MIFTIKLILPIFFCAVLYSDSATAKGSVPACSDLLVGQYNCSRPEINEQTQEINGCSKNGNATMKCFPLPNINCTGIQYFDKSVPCRYTNGYSYRVAVILSLFLGWLGIDRFYLGYPAIGLLKLCTFGVYGIGAMVDFFLILLQIVLPSDGSNYVIYYYGPKITRVGITNDTYYMPVPD